MARYSKKAIQQSLNNTMIDMTAFQQSVNELKEQYANTADYTKASDVVEVEYPDIISGYLKAGLTTLAGMSGIGKSWLAYVYAACVSSGKPFLGKDVAIGKVLVFCKEVTLSEMCKRLSWQGANLDNIILVADVESQDDKKVIGAEKTKTTFSLSEHFNKLEALVSQFGPSLIIFDTFMRFIDDKTARNTNKFAELVQKLEDIARTTGCSILAIAHMKNWISKEHHVSNLILAPSGLWSIARNGYIVQSDEQGNISLRNMKSDTAKQENLIYRIEQQRNGNVVVTFPQYCMLVSTAVVDPVRKFQHDIIAFLYERGCTNVVSVAAAFRSHGYELVSMQIGKLKADSVIEVKRFGCIDLSDKTRQGIDLALGKNVITAIPPMFTQGALPVSSNGYATGSLQSFSTLMP